MHQHFQYEVLSNVKKHVHSLWSNSFLDLKVMQKSELLQTLEIGIFTKFVVEFEKSP
jgi:hypothetical protein